ncbi:hypothetical protein Pmani_025385 [Petrolisthes manimaculis]|uniref:Uncharacterized protein n=1 Tax=Petrolisthes manimaculis TaxID=1843537 RepID=A0AAE1P5M9_9EUCA|nr:hypothetical protein Pmani_025385 [Petrolisthes manimaculis]
MAEKPKAPVKVGFYDIEKTIGKGNFAVVKLARHRITKTESGPHGSPESHTESSGTTEGPQHHHRHHKGFFSLLWREVYY